MSYMANIDKNTAIIDYLCQCPYIRESKLFFNFIEAKDNNKQILTTANDKAVDKPYIDGSIQKRFTFTIMDFKSITYNAIVKTIGHEYKSENIDEILEVQTIIDWITEQNELRNYPNFGTKCVIDNIEALNNNPNLNAVDTTKTPTLARYSVSIQVNYVDYSKTIWN